MHSASDEILREFAVPIVAILSGCTVAIIAIISCAIHGIVVGRARERTKQELAAYVAEGSLDAEKAVAIIEATEKPKDT